MNMFEEAASIEGMIKMRGLKQEDMAKLLGVSQPYVANKLRLLKFPPEGTNTPLRKDMPRPNILLAPFKASVLGNSTPSSTETATENRRNAKLFKVPSKYSPGVNSL